MLLRLGKGAFLSLDPALQFIFLAFICARGKVLFLQLLLLFPNAAKQHLMDVFHHTVNLLFGSDDFARVLSLKQLERVLLKSVVMRLREGHILPFL